MSAAAFNQGIRAWRAVLVVVVALSLGACASQQTPEQIAHVMETNDPYEPMNRAIFAFNEGLDVVILKPMAVWYRFLVPFPEARDTIRRVIDNAALPWTMVNEVFQGEWRRAQVTTTRFLINTTLGIGGMIDWATRWGYDRHSEDFGLTMARRFGAREGAFLMLPVFGPRNVRDTFGLVVDSVGDPVSWILPSPGGIVRAVVDGVDTRSRYIGEIDQLRSDSVDFYATLRSIWRQRRQSEVDRGNPQPQDIPRVQSDMGPVMPAAAAPPTAAPAAAPAERAPRRGPAARARSVQPVPATPPTAGDAAPIPMQTATVPWVTPQAAPVPLRASAPTGTPIRTRADGGWVVDPSSPSQGR